MRAVRLLASVGLVVMSGFLLFQAAAAYSGAMEAYDLRADYRENPLGIDEVAPRLSWKLAADQRAKKQSAYQILVATSKDRLREGEADLWDSGKVASSQSLDIPYEGRALGSRERVYWTVRVWDENDEPTNWSAPATWTMGLLEQGDWQATWIGLPQPDTLHVSAEELGLPASPFLRKPFSTDKKIARATLYATALGLYEMSINGERVGEDYFTPGWTDYHKRVYYNTYDVTNLLEPGANVIGAVLADGWYAGYVGFMITGMYAKPRGVYGEHPALHAQLEIEYDDGSREIIATDHTWKATIGPIKEADLLMGTTYDARDEMPGWNTASFDDAAWSPAVVMTPKHGKIEAYPGPTVQRTQMLEPVEITEREDGTYIVDLGQNFAGRVKLRMRGEAGQKVVLRHGEMLHQDGSLMTENLRHARATDTYILRGEDKEVWEPPFTFHGFRYVEVSGYPGTLTEDDIIGVAMHSATPVTGTLETSNPIVNKLYQNILWSQRSNFLEVPTDCPQRDERLGWTGDAQVFARTATYTMDAAAFFAKWLVDLEDAQYPRDHRLQGRRGSYLEVADMPDGAYPIFAPQPYASLGGYAAAWSDAGIIVPYRVFQAYGDTKVIASHYDGMNRFMSFLGGLSENYIVPSYGNDYGDWLAVDAPTPRESPTPKDLIATAYYASNARMMAEMAEAIGRNEDARSYRKLFANVKDAFIDAFVDDSGRIQGDTQTAYAMAIEMDLLPNELRAEAGRRLAELVDEENGLTTGFVGVSFLLPALTSEGHGDVAYELLTSTEYPSWGYSIVNGATTTWERWDSYTKADGFKDQRMNSFNHYAFGSVGEWLFASMAGIDSAEPGFGHLVVKPEVNADVDFVQASYNSVRGDVESEWRLEDGRLTLEVIIPPNTTATVHVPASDPEQVDEVLAGGEGVRSAGSEPGAAIFEIGSGRYRFVSDGISTAGASPRPQR